MAGIGVITNPRSRRNRRDPRLAEQLAYVLGEKGQVFMPGDLEAIEQVARRFLEHEIDVLAINGGDGTAHVVLSVFVQVYGERPLPRIALLRGGTMNTVATGLGVRGRPEWLLGRLVERYHSGQSLAIEERNLLRVGDHVGFLFGNGLVTSLLEVYYQGSEPTPWKALRLMIWAIGSALVGGAFIRRVLGPKEMEVEVDGRRWTHKSYLGLLAGTVDFIGLGFRPLPRVTQHPNRLEIMGFACSALRLAMLLPAMRRARLVQDPDVEVELAQRVTIRGSEPLAYTIDGDVFPAQEEIVLEVGPRVQLVVG